MAKFKTYAELGRMHKRMQKKYNGRKKARLEAETVKYEQYVQQKIHEKFFS